MLGFGVWWVGVVDPIPQNLYFPPLTAGVTP
jgi:hypothetical protein